VHSPRHDIQHSAPSSNDYEFLGDGAEPPRDPVFVDSTGRRARVVRLVKVVVTGACAVYTTVLGLSLAGAAAIAPSTLLPLPGVPSTSFRIEPADEPDKPHAAPRPKKAVTTGGTAGPESSPSLNTYEAASPAPDAVATTSAAPVTPVKSDPAPKPAPRPAPDPAPGKDPAPDTPPRNPGEGSEEPAPAQTPTPAPTPTPTPSPEPGPTDTAAPPQTHPGSGSSEGAGGATGAGGAGGAGGETSEVPLIGGLLDVLTTFSVPWFAAGSMSDGPVG
jgi:hypothetical protein